MVLLNYFGVNSFKFTNSKGASQYVRYQFVPEKGEELLTPEQIAKAGPDYLAKEIRERVANTHQVQNVRRAGRKGR